MKISRLAHGLATTGTCLGLVAVSGCTGSSSANAAGEFDEVVIAVPDWPGGEANAAVAEYVLESELDVDVGLARTGQPGAWDGLDDGSVHAVLEDWGTVPDKTELYRDRKGTVVDGGRLGITGHVGWFVPQAYADAHPEVLDWRRLNDFADDFATAVSGDKGQLLHGDPAYATWDDTLVDQLGLDFRPVAAGSEDALVEAISGADRDGTPLLAYWWQPHWLNARVELAEVALPPYTEGCHDDPNAVCGYPDIPLRKYLNADFAENGGAAAAFLRAFSWTVDDQNAVAELIAGQGMSPEAAAERWVTEHPAAVATWLGR